MVLHNIYPAYFIFRTKYKLENKKAVRIRSKDEYVCCSGYKEIEGKCIGISIIIIINILPRSNRDHPFFKQFLGGLRITNQGPVNRSIREMAN